jgi:hypothetical protein
MTRVATALSVLFVASSIAGCSGHVAPGGDPRPRNDAGTPDPVDAGPADACDDGLDGDADGRIDEDCMCDAGDQQRCFAGDPALAGVGACVWGTQDCVVDFEFGRWNECAGQGAPSRELCDRVDNDCDGETDEGCECVTDEARECYDGPDGTEGVGLCRAGTQMCAASGDGSEWTECEGAVVPSAESCDGGADEDCDGAIDEGCECAFGDSRDCYGGPPETRGVGECRAGEQACEGSAEDSSWGACAGEVVPRAESCTSGRDEDCDGDVDCDDSDCEVHPACCTPFEEIVPIVPPDAEILFVVDRSGSMDWPALGTTRTRWLELRGAMDEVLPSLEDLYLGLLTFPLMTGDAERLNCMVAGEPEIPIAFGSGEDIAARLLAVDPRAGDTPTPDALETARAYLESAPTSRQRFIVLLTDGLPEPNCGSTVPATVAALEEIRTDLGVDTFVLGIVGPSPDGDVSGIPALRDGLNQMADAGGRARAGDTRYFEAVDGPALTRALRAIMSAATDCEVALSSEPTRPDAIEVRQNDALVPADGWTLTGTRLELEGTWCDAIRAGTVTSISVSDECR